MHQRVASRLSRRPKYTDSMKTARSEVYSKLTRIVRHEGATRILPIVEELPYFPHAAAKQHVWL